MDWPLIQPLHSLCGAESVITALAVARAATFGLPALSNPLANAPSRQAGRLVAPSNPAVQQGFGTTVCPGRCAAPTLPSHDTGGLRPERWRRHGFGMKSHIAILPCWVLCVALINVCFTVSVGCEFEFELKADMHSDFVFLTLLCQRYQHDCKLGEVTPHG